MKQSRNEASKYRAENLPSQEKKKTKTKKNKKKRDT